MKSIVLIVLCLLLVSATGCCGLFAPTKDEIAKMMANTTGRPADEVVNRLRSKGFDIEDRTATAITARRATTCLLVEDFIWVGVRLDDKGNVESARVEAGRITP